VAADDPRRGPPLDRGVMSRIMRAASVIAAVVGLLSAIVCFLGLAAEALP